MALDRARLGRSFAVAGAGLARAWATQPNLRIEAAVGLCALALAAWLRAPAAPILLASALVLALELMNSAVEAVVDLVSPQHQPLAGTAKDLAAAAVLTASIGAAAVGLVVLGPPLLSRLGALVGAA